MLLEFLLLLILKENSCSAWKASDSSAASGFYVIAPGFQGGVTPFTVFCNMSEKNGVGVTVVSHDSENRTRVIGFDGKGEYVREVHYSGAGLSSIAQLVSLTDVSAYCEQFIKYECHHSRLLNSGSSFGWWVSRDSMKMTYWGGATSADSNKCACGVANTCKGCNCDKNDGVWREDSGLLMEKSHLPVKQLQFGDTGHDNLGEEGYHTLGKLKCYGIA